MFIFYLRSDNFYCSSSSVMLQVTASQTIEKKISRSQLICTFCFFLSFTEVLKVFWQNQLSSNSGRPACHCAQFSGLYHEGLLTPAVWWTDRTRSTDLGQQQGPNKIVSPGSSFACSHLPSFT